MHPGDRITTIEGLGTPKKMHPMQAAFVKHDGFQCGYCTPGQICSAVAMLQEIKSNIPSHVTADLTAPHARHGAGNPRAHERQHLPLRRVLEHRRGHRRRERRQGDQRMRPFSYERATTPAAAAAAAARNPGAKFIAGGTNLLDLMKLEIEKPAHLIDVNALALDKVEVTPDGGLQHRRAGAQHRSRRARTRAARLSTAVARLAGRRLRASCATARPPPAISCNARAARTSTTRTRPATSAIPAAAARRCRASAASSRWSVRAMPASRPILPTWRSRCARSMRRSKPCSRMARRGRFRSRTFTHCPATRRTSKTLCSAAS